MFRNLFYNSFKLPWFLYKCHISIIVYVVYKCARLQASCIIKSQFMMYLSNGENYNESNNVGYKHRTSKINLSTVRVTSDLDGC